MDRVIIGVDPHKRSVTFEARDTREVLSIDMAKSAHDL